MTQKPVPPGPDSHHANPSAVRADPGRTVADPPYVLFKTFVADLETAGTIPTERQHLLAAVTLELLITPPTPRI